MEKISNETYESIMRELELGDIAAKNNFFWSALKHYKNALSCIPIPKTDWEITLHVYVALADCYFNLGDYVLANSCYNNALLCPDATGYGYVWLGLGQTLYELGKIEEAKDALMRAYMLEGEEIFENEDKKYFDVIKEII